MADSSSTPSPSPDNTAALASIEAIYTRPLGVSDPTFQEIRQAVESHPAEERYHLQLEVGEHLLNLRDENTDAISQWYDYVVQSEDWKRERDEEGFRQEWERARRVYDKHQQNLSYIRTEYERAVSQWGIGDADSLFSRVRTKTMAEQVHKLLARNATFDQVRRATNHELVQRLGRVGRGHRRAKHMIQGDLVNAARFMCTDDMPPSDFKKHGLKLDPHGFLVESKGLPFPDITPGELEDEQEIEQMVPSEREGSAWNSQEDESSSESPEEDLSSEELPPTPPPTGSRRRKHQRRYQGGAAHHRYRQSPTPKNPRDRPQRSCVCGLPAALLRQFSGSPSPTDQTKLATLRKVTRALGIFSAEKMCFVHTKALSRYLGLYTRQFKHADLLQRLAYATRQIGSWEKFLQDKPEWFTPQNFPNGVERSSFRFKISSPAPRIARYTEYGFNLADICTRIYGTPSSAYQQWEEEFDRTGNVTLPKLFGWLEDDISGLEGAPVLSEILGQPVTSLMQLMHLEFDMYDYHYTPAISKPRLGWSRNMFQSLTQQLVRQDVCYYAAYVAIRPDHAWRLMAFPYYTKSAYPGEATGFTHIDLNIGDFLATGRGGNAVQGSVSFTDEDSENCTIVLRKMHLHLEEWWSKISSHPEAQTSGHTIVVYPWMWGKEEEERFGTSFEGVICKTGDVRLTLPVIPHGSTGPTTRLRRTMMPWFGVVCEDHERMETAEAGTWSEISDAHRDMRLSPRKPSGESSQKRAVRDLPSFPGVSHLTGLGDLSDALLGRIKWSEWSVITELNVLFGEDRAAAHRWVAKWRLRASRQFMEGFTRIVAAERSAYGSRSFFRLLKEGEPIPKVHLEYQKEVVSDGDCDRETDGDLHG